MSEERREYLLKKLGEENTTPEEKKELRKLLIERIEELKQILSKEELTPETKKAIKKDQYDYTILASVLPT